MRIVTTDTLVSPEPDDLLAIDKDRQDVIRTQRAARSFEGEMFDWLAVQEMKRAMSIGSDPNTLGSASTNRGHRTRGRICLSRFERIALIKEGAFFGASARTHPEFSARVGLQRVDKVATWLADDLLCLAIFNGD